MAVYKNIKAVKSLTNASLTSIVDLTNLNFNNLANGVLDFLGNIKYDEVLNTIALNQASFDFVNISDTLSIKLDNITTFSIDSLGRAEGQELLVSVAETQRLRLTDFNEWPDIGVPGEIIYTGIQNQKQEFGEDFIGYLQSRGWVSLTGLGQNYITLTQLILSPPFPPIPGPGKGTLWIGAQGYETAYEASTQTVYYTDEFGNIFDILSDFVWFKDGDDAKFKLPGKVIIGEVGDTKSLQYVDGNQTSGYVLTCDAQGNANWQPINNSNSVNCSYVTIQNFTAGITNVVTHNLDTTDVVIQLIKVDTNENITGYIDNYQLNTLDVTLSQSINNIKIIILSADCKSSGSASEITYDNTISGLLADDVNEAIDELAAAIFAIPSSSVIIDNMLFVTAEGNDSTGTRERLDLPFATPWAAVAAANGGDTVVVYPGTYATSSALNYLAKDGVTIHMYKNAVITYTGSANVVKPLWDQGTPITFKITGQGTLNMTQVIGGGTGVSTVMSAASSYDIELDTLQTTSRLRSSSGLYFKLKAREIRCTAECIAWRNTVSTTMYAHVECDILDHYTTTNVLTPFDWRNFSSTGTLVMKIGQYRAGSSFGIGFRNFGPIYLEGIHGNVIIKIDSFIENAQNLAGQARPIFVVVNGIGKFDIQIMNINHTGGIFNFATNNVGIISTGKLKMSGNITSHMAHNAYLVFSTGSKVEIDLDIVYDDQYSTVPVVMTSVDETIYVTGKVRYSSGALNPATTAFFVNQNSGGITPTPMATLKNFTMQTTTDYLVYGTGPTPANVKCMGVYSNKPLNIATHTATITPLVVDASITV